MSGLFWGALFLVFYAYFGYPITLSILGAVRKREVRKGPIEPEVTLVVTVHNEEKRLPGKIRNCLALNYPREKLQVIVASDGSTDRTNGIAAEHAGDGIELVATPERRGKENAQREAVDAARADILVFSDVATELAPDGLRNMIENFADPRVGCVSSEDRLIGQHGAPSGEGFYVHYEMWLRRLETRVNSLVGLSGSLFAARKAVCRDFSPELQSDFRTVLNSIRLGLRAVCDPDVVGYYPNVADEQREFERKVRTILRGITVFFRHPEFLNPLRYGFFAYQYFCHKLLRWSVPALLLLAFGASLSLAARGLPLYLVALGGQIVFYGTAFLVWKTGTANRRAVLKFPAYFLAVNASILVAWWRYLGGERVVLWKPSER